MKMHPNSQPNVIFLFISSRDDSVFEKMRKVIQVLFGAYKIKYFFVECRPNQIESLLEENDYIYVKGEECYIPGMYMKIMAALNYIADNYSYDYVVRANLSTFWNLPNLFDFLRRQPKTGLAAGFNVQGFITGTAIIMSRDVGILLHKNIQHFDCNDDVAISASLRSLNIDLYSITEYKWGYLIPRTDNSEYPCIRFININDDDFSDILQFRLKNADRNLDVAYMKILLKRLYDIHLE